MDKITVVVISRLINAEICCQREFVISWPPRNLQGDPSRRQIRPRLPWTSMYKTPEILGIVTRVFHARVKIDWIPIM